MSVSETTETVLRARFEPLRAHLGMKYELVGVRLVSEENCSPDMFESLRPPRRMWYCAMVMEAARGAVFAATLEDMGCPNSELALGLRKPKYTNMPVMIKENIKAVVIGPLDAAEVVLFVLTPKQAMKMALLMGGLSAEFTGETAVCGEATAMVRAQGIPNMTLLCNGARMYGGYSDSEVVVGLPPFLLEKILEKVLRERKCGGALCGCLVSDLPGDIIQNFKHIGFEKSTDYFMGKISGLNVRVYLEKDEHGVLKNLVLHIPIRAKGKIVDARPPFFTSDRGDWVDVHAVIDPKAQGIDLYSGGDAMLKVFTDLILKHVFVKGKDA